MYQSYIFRALGKILRSVTFLLSERGLHFSDVHSATNIGVATLR